MNLDKETLATYGFIIKDPPLGEEFDILSRMMSKLQLNIVANRMDCGFKDVELLDTMYNRLSLYNNIDKLKDVYKAADLIVKHIKNNSKILIATDYDADGITSAVTLTKSFLNIFKYPSNKVLTFVNKRKNGNGFNNVLTERILAENNKSHIDLIITADHGSTDNSKYKVFKELGIDIVVTDHHQIPVDNYPTYADVLVNNQREDSTFSKHISGCCVAFITMLATYEKLFGTRAKDEFNAVMPYVAISTITDVMSLKVPYNRHIVATGLNEINSYRNKGWVGINTVIGLDNKIAYKDIGFKLGPLINTGSRLDVEELVFETLMAESHSEAFMLASKLNEHNQYRKTVTKEISKYYVKAYKDNGNKTHVFVADTDIDIKGNLATKLGLVIGKPCVCFMDRGNKYSGSTRGILPNVNVHEVLTSIKDNHNGIICVSESGEHEFGGHYGAAGVSIYKDKLDIFSELFEKYAVEQINNNPMDTGNVIDAIIKNTDIGPDLAFTIDACGPYGKDWPQPVLLSKFKIEAIYTLGSICKILLRCDDDVIIEGFHFFNNIGKYTADNIKSFINRNDEVLVSYTVDIERFNGLYNVGLSIVNITKVGE